MAGAGQEVVVTAVRVAAVGLAGAPLGERAHMTQRCAGSRR